MKRLVVICSLIALSLSYCLAQEALNDPQTTTGETSTVTSSPSLTTSPSSPETSNGSPSVTSRSLETSSSLPSTPRLMTSRNSDYQQLDQDEREFVEWMRKYDKHYATDEEYFAAFEEFLKAKEVIDENNAQYEQGNVSFRQERNKFADLSEEDRRRLSSGFRPSSTSGMAGRSVILINPGMFPPGPPSFDWREKGAVTEVKDQGFFCSCCWAFSACAALESHIFIKRGKLHTLSEQNLIDCNRNPITGNWGCGGGSQSSAFMYVQQIGIEPSETYPYQEDVQHEKNYTCRFNSSNSIGKITGYFRLRPNNETLLRDVVAAVGPVSFAMNSEYDPFLYYKEGVFDDLNCKKGFSHSALIVGYGTMIKDDGTKVDYWICKNSWSADWGEKGYFRMLRGKNICGMTGFLIVPIVV